MLLRKNTFKTTTPLQAFLRPTQLGPGGLVSRICSKYREITSQHRVTSLRSKTLVKPLSIAFENCTS